MGRVPVAGQQYQLEGFQTERWRKTPGRYIVLCKNSVLIKDKECDLLRSVSPSVGKEKTLCEPAET
jgi:hypothetical protein